MQDFEISPASISSSLLYFIIFPRSPCRKSSKTRVTGLQVFLVLPDEVSLNASSPRLRSWPWGKPSPTQDGSPEIFFFLTIFFYQKKTKRMVIFAVFEGTIAATHSHLRAYFSFCLVQRTFLVRWTVRGKDY